MGEDVIELANSGPEIAQIRHAQAYVGEAQFSRHRTPAAIGAAARSTPMKWLCGK